MTGRVYTVTVPRQKRKSWLEHLYEGYLGEEEEGEDEVVTDQTPSVVVSEDSSVAPSPRAVTL